jgi:WD40 repeat protein
LDISDISNPKFLHEFVGHQQAITCVALVHEDQQFISCSIDYNVFFYDIRTQRREASWNFEGSAQVLAVTPDQSLVVVGGSHYGNLFLDIE